MYCDTNQLPALPFCGPHPKPHKARETTNHYHLRFDTKLGHGIFEIIHTPFACVGFTSVLEKPWISGIPSNKQELCEPITNCTYWPVMGSYNNFNVIELSPKSIPFEAFDEIYKVILGIISENVTSLVQ